MEKIEKIALYDYSNKDTSFILVATQQGDFNYDEAKGDFVTNSYFTSSENTAYRVSFSQKGDFYTYNTIYTYQREHQFSVDSLTLRMLWGKKEPADN